MTAKGLKKI